MNMLFIISWNSVDYMDQLSSDQLIDEKTITPHDKPVIYALDNVYIGEGFLKFGGLISIAIVSNHLMTLLVCLTELTCGGRTMYHTTDTD